MTEAKPDIDVSAAAKHRNLVVAEPALVQRLLVAIGSSSRREVAGSSGVATQTLIDATKGYPVKLATIAALEAGLVKMAATRGQSIGPR